MSSVRALVLTKGATNIAAADTIGIRLGLSYSDSVELFQVAPNVTNIMTALHTYVGPVQLHRQGTRLSYLSAGPTAAVGVLLVRQEDPGTEGRLWIRRNAAQAATAVVATTDLGTIIQDQGGFRTTEEMNAILMASFDQGVRASVALAEAVFA